MTDSPEQISSPLPLWRRLVAPHPSIQDTGAQYRASLLAGMGLILSLLSLIGMIAGYIVYLQQGMARSAAMAAAFLSASFLTVYVLARTRHYRLGAVFMAGMLTIAAVFLAGGSQDMPTAHLYSVLPLMFIFGIAMFNTRGMWILFIVTLLALVAVILLRPDLNTPAAFQTVGTTVGIAILAIIVVYFNKTVENARLTELKDANRELTAMRGELEKRVAERTRDITQRTLELEKYSSQLEIVAQVARVIAAVQDLNQLLPSVCRAVSEQFGYYHTGIFLLDERSEFAILQAASSPGGQEMLKHGHRLRVGVAGIVGFVAGRGEPRVALDVEADAAYFDNPYLPKTRSEMALPLQVGNRIIGVLDVQSEEFNAFHEEDVSVLGTLANQVAIAIENARLFSQTRLALEESQAVYQQYIKQDWARFAQTLKHHGYTYDGTKIIPLGEDASGMGAAGLTVPVKIRGLAVGQIVVHSTNPLRQWTQDEVGLAQAAAERAGLAIENVRLLTEAQRRAAKERTISKITSKISSSVELGDILQTAVEELGRILPGSEVTVQFNRGKGETNPPTARQGT